MKGASAIAGPAAPRIVLLAGQAFALGLMVSWLLIPASAIFLSTYGSGLLPVTYLGAAAAGVASSAALAAAFRRRPLASVALRVLAVSSMALVLSWVLLSRGLSWISFGLLVVVPIVVPVGFMLLVGQAGMLLDVRALKALYARVIAGFALGFVAGGVAAPTLLEVLGRAEHLVLAAAGAGGLWAVLLVVTRRRFPIELSAIGHEDAADAAEAPGWSDLLRHRYVVLIIAFQMLSAVESQWLDYLVFDRASQRYEDSEELARFISRFTAVTYGADIVFLLLIAGLLLRRFGLRYGLTANPGVVLTLVIAVVAMSSLQGAGAATVFGLIVGARMTDLVFSDGAARASLSAAYQVVPTQIRLAAQAGVEGVAVPLAIGVSGVVLLLLRATVGTGGVVLPVLVGVVVTTWLLVAVLLSRSYRSSLLTALRYRTLDLSILAIDDPNSLAVVDRLLESEDPRDVRLGLDALEGAQHPDLPQRLDGLTSDDRPIVRIDALERLSRVDSELGATAARRTLDDPHTGTRAAAVRVLGAIGDPSDLPAVEVHRADADAEVRAAALAAVARLGGGSMRARVSTEVALLAASRHGPDRRLAAEVLGVCHAATDIDRSSLAALILDADPDVANGALRSTRWPQDRELLGHVARALRVRATAGDAAEALVRAGALALPAVSEGLADDELDRRVQLLLVRIGREIGGPSAAVALADHRQHPDRDVGLAVLTALGALKSNGGGPSADQDHVDAGAPIVGDLEHAIHVLRAIIACHPHPAARSLQAGLRDELDLLRRRVLAALAVRYGDEPIARVSFQFARGDSRSSALAIEWLDVTLVGTDRWAVALIEPAVSEQDRLRRLSREIPVPDVSFGDVLHDLVMDPERRWRRPWLRACALHAAWSVPSAGIDIVGVDPTPWEIEQREGSSIVRETLEAIRAKAQLGAQREEVS